MGYYSHYWLTVEQGQTELKQVYECLTELLSGEDLFFTYEDGEDQITSDGPLTWYTHDLDCAELSRRFPGVTFCLEGNGEDSIDMWKTYYLNGQCQICRAVITYPPFDPAKLTTPEEAQWIDQTE